MVDFLKQYIVTKLFYSAGVCESVFDDYPKFIAFVLNIDCA